MGTPLYYSQLATWVSYGTSCATLCDTSITLNINKRGWDMLIPAPSWAWAYFPSPPFFFLFFYIFNFLHIFQILFHILLCPNFEHFRGGFLELQFLRYCNCWKVCDVCFLNKSTLRTRLVDCNRNRYYKEYKML